MAAKQAHKANASAARAKPAAESPALKRFTRICLSLPEVSVERSGKHAVYKVGAKVFANFLDDHHGDGKVAINCKAAPGENTRLIEEDPERFYFPAYSGPRGWMAMRLDVGKPDWEQAAGFALKAYVLTAPKKLAARVMG